MSLFFIDCEAPMGVGSPATGDMTEFGAVEFDSRASFHGMDCSKETFTKFGDWILKVNGEGRPTMISDNPAYDWQWINFYFDKYFGANPLGFSARRIGDFYAGMVRNFGRSNKWKKLRVTKHDHNPVNDAMGNAEAFQRILKGEIVR
jgi:hypothetical protein